MPEVLSFHRFVRPVEVPPSGRQFKVAADEAERAALARALDLADITEFTAELTLLPLADGLSARGTLHCKLSYACVVTLEPFGAEITEPVAREFRASVALGTEDVDMSPDDDPPDALTPEGADIGACLAETLSLALDPYPRKPGAEFIDAAGTNEALSPFAVLGKLKGGDEG